MPRPARKSQAAPEERLLRLTALLLSRHEPMTFEEIRDALPGDYKGKPGAVDRMWTRDKNALVAAGIPIEFVEAGEESSGGYLIDPRNYYLPQLELGPEELAVLWTAGNAAAAMGAHPWHADLESALRKLGCLGAEPPARRRTHPAIHFGDGPVQSPRKYIDALGDAVRRRKTVHLKYFAAKRQEETEREVDVYGFAWRRGVWLFAGWCHLRKALRVFYLSRVHDLRVNSKRPSEPDYAIPDDFDIHAFAEQQPWDYVMHEPTKVVVRFTGDLAPLAGELLKRAKVEQRDGAAYATVTVSNIGALVRQVMTFGPQAELVEPPTARAQAKAILERIASSAGGSQP